uniref:PRELI/MSF1 domain-containing protein n=1 Tax=Globodera rostochiensis TaxID=31243 RepID=A0A914HQ04_GLORO
MGIFSNEKTFDYPWEKVVTAAIQKYPNPENDSVSGIDVVSQQVRNGQLHSERILQTKFNVMAWASKLVGFFSPYQYSLEYSVIDPKRKIMRLNTRNLCLPNQLKVDEHLEYTPHPTDPNRTIMKQWTEVSVNLPMLSDYCESVFLSIYQNNAMRGPKGLEWVINNLHCN